jgi:opacity protein-like surface antigen
MKKIITTLILSIGLIFNSASAQEGAYLNVFGAYALAAASTTSLVSDGVFDVDTFAMQDPEVYDWLNVTTTATLDADGMPVFVSDFSQSKINLGKGISFGANFGYMFNDNIGAELGLSYFLGSKSTFMQEFDNQIDPSNTELTSVSGEIYANQFRITPSLVISTDFNDFVPYAKFGVVLGLGTKVVETYDDKKYFGTENVVQEFTSKGGMAIGVSGTLGALYQLNKKTGIFLELTSTAMNYAPKTRTLTAYTINGDDELNEYISVQASETEYVKETTITTPSEDDPTLSTLASQIKYPMSSFTFNLGIRFSF